MPWRESSPVDERMRFVIAAQQGTVSMAELCRRFSVSRKTGYKWLARHVAEGPAGLVDRPPVAHSRPHALAPLVQELLIQLRIAQPLWGPRKLVAHFARLHPELEVPAASTVGDLLHTAGLTVPRKRKPHVPPRTEPLAHATGPNVVWCADFKGDFALVDDRRCYPLAISDAFARYFLRCQALTHTTVARVQPLFEATFREFGLPEKLRTDNGPPFASTAIGGLTALSVWWVKLGIHPERIDPGKPQQNGRHERLHRTLKAEACMPPAVSLRAQQLRFDRFRSHYNDVRPHEALGQVPPATVYTPSPRPFPARLPVPNYGDDCRVLRVRQNGCIRWKGGEVYLSQVIAGEPVGLTAIDERSWEVSFGSVLLGSFQLGMKRLRPPRPEA